MIDPLSLPWGAKPKRAPEEKKPTFIGVKNEAVRDGQAAKARIKISVSGVMGLPNAVYEIAYEPGLALKYYLDKLKLKRAAFYAALRDVSNPNVGRVRMTYIPTEKSHITLGNPDVSSVLHLQRSSHDAMEIARNMGKEGHGPAPKVVERKK